MINPARPVATLLALTFTLALWAPVLANGALASAANRKSAGEHMVFASASPIVLM